MNHGSSLRSRYSASLLVTTLWFTIASLPVQAQTFTVVHDFSESPDGAYPAAPLARDERGNLYGASSGGGLGWGTIFKISPTGEETVLYNFQDGADGILPFLSFVESETIFGTSYQGGVNLLGTVFMLDANGKLTILYSCCLGTGAFPAGVVRGKNRDLYGITFAGGDFDACDPTGCGTMFKLNRQGVVTFIHLFGDVPGDGEFPNRSLVPDRFGTVYGTTQSGGASGYGTVFRIKPGGHETILYSFQGGADGDRPWGGVYQDGEGNLYGTTQNGGSYNHGTLYKITSSSEHLILHSFNGTDGALPIGAVTLDENGNIYGVTYEGGSHGRGTVFKLDANANLTVLHEFAGVRDGEFPEGVLLVNGVLYGVTYQGGAYNYGVVFKLVP